MFMKLLVFFVLLLVAVRPAHADEEFLAKVKGETALAKAELEKVKAIAEYNAAVVKSTIEGIQKTCQELRELQAALDKAEEEAKATEARLKMAKSLAAKLVTTSPYLQPRPTLLEVDRHGEETPAKRRARVLVVCQEFLESQKEEIPPPPEVRTPHDTTSEDGSDFQLYKGGEGI